MIIVMCIGLVFICVGLETRLPGIQIYWRWEILGPFREIGLDTVQKREERTFVVVEKRLSLVHMHIKHGLLSIYVYPHV